MAVEATGVWAAEQAEAERQHGEMKPRGRNPTLTCHCYRTTMCPRNSQSKIRLPVEQRVGVITFIKSLSAAGFAAVAISFYPERMAFSLFVPQFTIAFSRSSTMVGVASMLRFAGFSLMRKLIELANALVQQDRKWTPKPARSRQIL
ncbi:hypothetical protein [Palleronia marisminoris]|uniref:hypothetical protein n=1 Tax=Palleronia marisminoris TaxID=315423 RepID=UPI000A26EE7A|nr:hypothetical protein [Palleronia marisminoris]